jgi:outer membrane receptor protein involved in Fe transport
MNNVPPSAIVVSLLVVLCLVAIGVPTASAQDAPAPAAGGIEGAVLTKGTREPVPLALVKIETLAREATTDDEGRFRFADVPPGEYTLHVTEEASDPYKRQVVVEAGKTARVTCYVARLSYTMDEVLVIGEKETQDTTRQEISKEELAVVPGAGGDVIRVVENLPGVTKLGPRGDFTGEGLVIRGVSPEDSLYLLNDFRIPQLFHFGSAISVINSELISDVAYYPGGYSVKYGNALGGIIEVNSRGPRTDRFGGVADLGSYSAYLLLEGPIGKQFAWAATVRRSFIDLILPYVVPEDQAQFTLLPRFYDYAAIMEVKPDPKNRVQFMFMGSDDRMGLIAELDSDEPFAGNSFDMSLLFHEGNVRWETAPDDRIANTFAANVLYSDNKVEFGRDQYYRDIDFEVEMRDDFSMRLGPINELRCGAVGTYDRSNVILNIVRPPKEGHPGTSLSNSDLIENEFKNDLYAAALYLDDVIRAGRYVQLIPGARVDYLSYLNEWTADPRLLMKFFPAEKATIKAAVGVYHQWPGGDEMIEGIGNPDLDAEVAYEGILGFEYDFGFGYSLDVQGYYKYLDELVSPTVDDPVPYQNTGVGYVYGAELLVRKKLTDRLFGWLSYSYAVSRRQDTPDAECVTSTRIKSTI